MTSYPRVVACVLCFSALALMGGCGSDPVGKETDGGGFIGDDPSSKDPGSDPPESGQSECSMFDVSSCPEDEACTPTAQGTRRCEESGILPVGDPCDPSSDERCVGGALCFGAHHNGSVCVKVCDLSAPECPEEQQCLEWYDVDGEALGRCN